MLQLSFRNIHVNEGKHDMKQCVAIRFLERVNFINVYTLSQ